MYRIALLFLSLNLISSLGNAQTDLNWSEDMACIIYSHCTNCHNSNGVAPFALESYDDVISYKEKIMVEVLTGSMPPWPAKTPANSFMGDHSLSQAEISAIEEWINGGAPMGDLSLAPDAPVFGTNIVIQNPDLVIELPEYKVPDLEDNDLYKCFVFPMDFDEDVFINALEVIPGNPKAVHHVLLYQEPSNIPQELDEQDPEIGYTCFGGIGSWSAELVGGWAPGGDPQFFPDGMGVRLPKKTNLVVQVHYPSYSAGEVDQTSIRLKYSTSSQRELEVVPLLNHFTSMTSGPLYVPANEVREFTQLAVLNSKTTVVGVAPHAHLICTEMESWAERPNGEIVNLVETPSWNFDWQKFYAYKEPIILEAGTKIHGRAVYDNTVNNHHNPNFPPQTITVGEDTDEEMMIFFYTMTDYETGDELLNFEESLHIDHIENCGWELTNNEELNSSINIDIFPNPASDILNFESEITIREVIIYDLLGRKIKGINGINITKISTESLRPGTYSIQLKTEELILVKQIVIGR